MYETSYTPTDTAAVLTTGAIGKLADAAAEARNLIAKTNPRSPTSNAGFPTSNGIRPSTCAGVVRGETADRQPAAGRFRIPDRGH